MSAPPGQDNTVTVGGERLLGDHITRVDTDSVGRLGLEPRTHGLKARCSTY